MNLFRVPVTFGGQHCGDGMLANNICPAGSQGAPVLLSGSASSSSAAPLLVRRRRRHLLLKLRLAGWRLVLGGQSGAGPPPQPFTAARSAGGKAESTAGAASAAIGWRRRQMEGGGRGVPLPVGSPLWEPVSSQADSWRKHQLPPDCHRDQLLALASALTALHGAPQQCFWCF